MQKIVFANMLRGVAALLVMVTHYCGGFWSDRAGITKFTNIPTLSVDSYPTPGFTHIFANLLFSGFAAHFSVALFFLISGFVIPFSFRRMNWDAFFAARLWRILPTYAAGFSIVLLAIWCGGLFFHRPFPYKWSQIIICSIPGVTDFFDVQIINPIEWTLNVEMKFYVICAFSSSMLRSGSKLVFSIPAALALFAVATAFGTAYLSPNRYCRHLIEVAAYYTPLLIFMFIGVAIHHHHERKLSTREFVVVTAVLYGMFVGTTCYLYTKVFPEYQGRAVTIISLYSVALLVFLAAYFEKNLFRKENRISRFFSDISYPLYVTHQIPGWVALRILVDLHVDPLVAVILVMAGICTVAWFLHIGVEVPTHNIGKRIAYRLAERS